MDLKIPKGGRVPSPKLATRPPVSTFPIRQLDVSKPHNSLLPSSAPTPLRYAEKGIMTQESVLIWNFFFEPEFV